jgi:CBS domain containing-hemolysin-like protein
MAAFTDGMIGFLTSTILIVIFGEILPQALVRRLQKQAKGGRTQSFDFL